MLPRLLHLLLAVTRGLAALALGGAVRAAAVGASAPPPPGGLTALSLDGHVVLGWTAVPGATYAVYRGTLAAPAGTQLAAGLATSTFADTGAVNGSTYVYVVRATVGGVESANSNLAQAEPIPRAATAGNAIALENSFPGSTAWKLKGAAQPPTGLEGFATASSVNAGQAVDLKVTTKSGAPYHIEIYRVGYYGGAQARLISVLPQLVGVTQPFPQKDLSTGFIDCSGWSVTATITTTPDWPSGIYLLRLARDDNTSDNHILLVVRNDGAVAEIGYALSVATYQAYNDWGGKSLYTWNSTGDNTVAGTPRAVKVSFDRPYNQSLDRQVNFFTQCDIQNVSWLEEQGYDVTYLTNLDVHTGSPLGAYRALVSPAHDEYWSAEVRAAFTAARDGGTSLMFFGANGAYWKVRFEANPHSGAANRVLVCYKTIESGGPDPSGSPTTTWRDPIVNQPENALLGQMYIGDNGSLFYPLVVNGAQAQNRIWRHTSLPTLAPTASASIGQYLVGWEWDARSSNGFEPAGLAVVAASPVTGELLTDAGHTHSTGSTTSHATVYKAASGAWVFASGTNQWSRGLGVDIDGDGEPNLVIQQATLNLLTDMGAHATTPSHGLVLDGAPVPAPTPTTAPAAAAGVAAANAVTATFDRALDPATVNGQTFTLTASGGAAVAASVTYDGTAHTATLTPAAPLSPGAPYTAALTTGIHGADGSPLTAPLSWTFTLGHGPFSLFAPTLAPAIVGASVQDGRSGTGPWSFEFGVKIAVTQAQPLTAIRFYKDAKETGAHVGRVWSAAGSLLAQTTFATETASGWQEQKLATSLMLQPGQVYVVSVGVNAFFVATHSALANQIVAGPLESVADGVNGVYGSAVGTFPTKNFQLSNYFVDVVVAGSTAPPPPVPSGQTVTETVTKTVPAANATGIGSLATAAATFSVPLDPTSITGTTFTLAGPGGTVVPASVAYDAGAGTAALTPSQPLQPGTIYTATLTTGIRDSGGNPLAAPVTWAFTTTNGSSLFSSAQTPPLVHLAVKDGRAGAGPFSYELGVKIEVDSAARLTAIRFYKDSGETGTHVGRVWSSSGALLAQTTFANESASGWQQQALSSPLTLQPGQVYILSININAFFVDGPSGLAAQITAAPLKSVADGQNGVHGPAAGTFPTTSYKSSNYFVDALVL
jgi:hypothetical protein